jgi:sarcosine oxidase subunit delta
MRIECPYCGPRGSEEFVYMGDAGVRRPPEDAPAEAFHDYVYLRDNPAGRHAEYWLHAHGCRSVVVVSRDTRTHAVFSVSAAGDAP